MIFSSPGGIIVGPTGVFDVGNLVLTSLNVGRRRRRQFLRSGDARPQLRRRRPSPLNAAIITEPGAQIRALEQSSYRRHGRAGDPAWRLGPGERLGRLYRRRAACRCASIRACSTSSSTSAATMRCRSSTPARPAARPAPAPATIHAIYLVAMPKNQAITAILQGNIGFDPAVAAGVENGVIVLSAGANVVGGNVDRYGDLTGTPGARSRGELPDQRRHVRSDLIGVARTDMLRPAGRRSRRIAFQQDVSLFGGSSALHRRWRNGQIDRRARQRPRLGGRLRHDPTGVVRPDRRRRRGSSPRAAAAIHITGSATVDASARGLVNPAGDGGSGTGGTAAVIAERRHDHHRRRARHRRHRRGRQRLAAPVANRRRRQGRHRDLVRGRSGGTVTANGARRHERERHGQRVGRRARPSTARRASAARSRARRRRRQCRRSPATSRPRANGAGGAVFDGTGLNGGTRRRRHDQRARHRTAISTSTPMRPSSRRAAAASAPTGGTGQGGDLVIEATRGTIDFLGADRRRWPAASAATRRCAGGLGGDGQGGKILFAARSGDAPLADRRRRLRPAATGTGRPRRRRHDRHAGGHRRQRHRAATSSSSPKSANGSDRVRRADRLGRRAGRRRRRRRRQLRTAATGGDRQRRQRH